MIELAEVINQLRVELDKARAAAVGAELQFALGPVELEVLVSLEQEGGVGGKVRFWVVELGADGKVTSASTQRIKLSLQPQVVASGQAGTGSESTTAFVGGAREPGER
jgi:NTP-dependent ternary system trypsin peptidase co-occuring protein